MTFFYVRKCKSKIWGEIPKDVCAFILRTVMKETITNTHLTYTLNADGLFNFSVDG